MREETYTAASWRLDANDLTPYLAGQVGQATLIRLAGQAHPQLDQHLAAVDAAARQVLGHQYADPARVLAFLVRYASGFTAAAIGGDWCPAGPGEPVDWASMRLAAVCQLVMDLGSPQLVLAGLAATRAR